MGWRPRRIWIAALVAYPLVSHAALYAGYPHLAVSALLVALFAAGVLAWPRAARMLTVALLAGLVGAARLPAAALLLYLPPIAINAALLVAFARTLLPGRRPLITRFAEDVLQERRPERRPYMRAVTWAWTLLFAGLTVECVLLAAFAGIEQWSLYANVLNYVFVAALFVVEFAFRRAVFGERVRVVAFFQSLAGANLAKLSKD